MRRILIGSAVAGLALAAASLLWWPAAKVSAQPAPQLNAEACTCSRATNVGAGRDQVSVYYCTCPAMQCVLSVTAPASAVPPNLVQNCRDVQAR